MQYILTAQASAMELALAEAGNARVVRQLEPGVALCDAVTVPGEATFLRHSCPAAVAVGLDGASADVEKLRDALIPLLDAMPKDGGPFSVQTRIIEGCKPQYKRFDINAALSDVAQAAGLVLDVKEPEWVISVTVTGDMGWLGVSTAAENLSAWAGGMRRFKWEDAQVSRAEFKLLEALETFAITTRDGGRALDLGAAPGGWTRVLRRRGLYVTAVDPAALDPRIIKDKRVTHYRGAAQAYFRGTPAQVDLMVNDMKMDSAESAALMAEGAGCLRPGGDAVLTLKLPDDAGTWLARVEQAREILRGEYAVLGMRQLFHNRSEVTAYLRKK